MAGVPGAAVAMAHAIQIRLTSIPTEAVYASRYFDDDDHEVVSVHYIHPMSESILYVSRDTALKTFLALQTFFQEVEAPRRPVQIPGNFAPAD